MSGVKVPNDRIVTQPCTGFCRNPECCDEHGQEFTFPVENDHFSCPKCGANSSPYVGVLVLTHLLVRHPQGPITGKGGLKYAIACDEKRAYLATVTNKEAATDNVEIANCPGCLENAKKLGIEPRQAWAYKPGS